MSVGEPRVSRPGSTNVCAFEVEQHQEGDAEGLGDSEQIQIGGIPSADFEAADVRAVQAALTGQVLLGPVLGDSEVANALAKASEVCMRSRSRRHRPMLTTVHRLVYRPGSTVATRRCYVIGTTLAADATVSFPP